jgi:hypothetical protein
MLLRTISSNIDYQNIGSHMTAVPDFVGEFSAKYGLSLFSGSKDEPVFP